MFLRTLLLAGCMVALSIPAYTQDDESISFVAIGDSGYEGSWFDFFGSWYGVRAQHWAPGRTGLYEMAELLRGYCQQQDCDFGVMLGDNIYPDGVEGKDLEDDMERFKAVFHKPFKPLHDDNPDFRIYPTLGNHDWRGKRLGAMSQLQYLSSQLPFAMEGLFYTVKPHPEIELFVIDTEMMLSQVTVYNDHLNDDGSPARDEKDLDPVGKDVGKLSSDEAVQIEWLQGKLEASDARWKFVVAHHPLWSSGSTKFEQANALRELLMPVLCGRADGYFAGHEHTQEVHSDSCETVIPKGEAKPLLHVVSGAFSKSRLVNPAFKAYQARTNPNLSTLYAKGKEPEGSEHQYKQTWGFAHITLKDDTATVQMITHTEDEALPTTPGPDFTCTFTKGEGFPVDGCAARPR